MDYCILSTIDCCHPPSIGDNLMYPARRGGSPSARPFPCTLATGILHISNISPCCAYISHVMVLQLNIAVDKCSCLKEITCFHAPSAPIVEPNLGLQCLIFSMDQALPTWHIFHVHHIKCDLYYVVHSHMHRCAQSHTPTCHGGHILACPPSATPKDGSREGQNPIMQHIYAYLP